MKSEGQKPNLGNNGPENDPRYLSSVERGFRVLDALSLSTGPMSLTELAQHTQLAVPTLQRLTTTLIEAGYVQKIAGTKRYCPTVRTVDLLHSYLSRNQFAKRAWPYLVKLREELGLDVSLSVPVSNSMIYVHRLPGYRGNFENTLPGKKIPMHLSASGRCLLSLKSKVDLKTYLESVPLASITPWSVTDPDTLMEEISQCRNLGYAFVKQEASPGMMTLACPITRGVEVIAGISVHAPVAGSDQAAFVATVIPAVVAMSQALSSG